MDELGLCAKNQIFAPTATKETQTEHARATPVVHYSTNATKTKKASLIETLAATNLKKKKIAPYEKDAILELIAIVYDVKHVANLADDKAGFKRDPLADILEVNR